MWIFKFTCGKHLSYLGCSDVLSFTVFHTLLRKVKNYQSLSMDDRFKNQPRELLCGSICAHVVWWCRDVILSSLIKQKIQPNFRMFFSYINILNVIRIRTAFPKKYVWILRIFEIQTFYEENAFTIHYTTKYVTAWSPVYFFIDSSVSNDFQKYSVMLIMAKIVQFMMSVQRHHITSPSEKPMSSYSTYTISKEVLKSVNPAWKWLSY